MTHKKLFFSGILILFVLFFFGCQSVDHEYREQIVERINQYEEVVLLAEAIRTDNYRESDLAWMQMKDNNIDFIVRPLDTGEALHPAAHLCVFHHQVRAVEAGLCDFLCQRDALQQVWHRRSTWHRRDDAI